MAKLYRSVWLSGCLLTFMILTAKSQTPLLRPWVPVHPEGRIEPVLDPSAANRGLRRRYVYSEFGVWEVAHSEWRAQLVPVGRTQPYARDMGILIIGLVGWTIAAWGSRATSALMWHRIGSEGVRRLAILVGAAAVVGFFLYSTSNGLARISLTQWTILIVGLPISFTTGFASVWAVSWVQGGFSEDRMQ